MKMFLAVAALLFAVPAFSQHQPASEASIRELLALTNSKAILEQAYGQIDGMMEKAMNDAMSGKPRSAEQEKLLAEFRSKIVTAMTEQMSLEFLEPAYIKLYGTTFSQGEIDGMNAFYKSQAGKAVIAKMPQLMTAVMQLVMDRMTAVMPKVQAIKDEYVARLKELQKP